MEFRNLYPHEIELRVGTINKNGCSLLLYKDSRADMNVLDETVGAMNWQRQHSRDNANCTVAIWDNEKQQWVSKEDTGTESYTEKEKGLASDSFKRACVNWGVGRELYSAPFIWINLTSDEVIKNDKTGKYQLGYKTKFKVSHIDYIGKNITGLEIVDKDNKKRYSFKEDMKFQAEIDNLLGEKILKKHIAPFEELIVSKGGTVQGFCEKNNLKSIADMTMKQFHKFNAQLEKMKDVK